MAIPNHIIRSAIITFFFLSPLYTHAESPFFTLRTVIYGDGSPGPYSIGKRYIQGTVVLESQPYDSLTIAHTDDVNSTVTFNRPILSGDSVTVSVAVPPNWLQKTYGRPQNQNPAGSKLLVPYTPYRDRIPKSFPGLQFGGSKTFEISTGSERSASLNQSLHLSISGNLTDDITLSAAISDQNVPLTPEGSTRELNELDRVLIEVKGKQFSISMGDNELQNTNGRWLSYMRRLSGAQADITTGGIKLRGSGAVSEGRYMSTTITPVEGNQGPYRLINEKGQMDISIIPGTERIWINGGQLTRGSNDDYIIDYETGEITFTENRIIGSDMRIVCDYEYTSDSYRRTFYSAGAEGSFLDNRLKVSTVFAREADDSNRPVLVEMNAQMKKQLSQSGDSTATVPGLRNSPGDSTGTYDLIEDHLVYNPFKKGVYNATFSWVGQDNGSYRYKGGGIYEFVPTESRGLGSGASYEPVAVIPSPVSHDIAGIISTFSPVSALSIETELVTSSLDKNTLSSLNDSNNNGSAYRIGMNLSPALTIGIPLKFDLRGTHRMREKQFIPLDRDRSAEENRQWGLPLIWGDSQEIVSEYSGKMSVNKGKFSGTGIDINGGRAEYGGSSLSSRVGIGGKLIASNSGSFDLLLDRITRQNIPGLPDEKIGRYTGKSQVTVRGFTSTTAYEGERAEGLGSLSYGTLYHDIRTSLGIPEQFGIKSDIEWFYRIEQMKHDTWADSSHVRGGNIGLSYGNGISGLVKARYEKRERIGKFNTAMTNLALLEGFLKPEGKGITVDVSYRAGRSRESSLRQNYIFTGDGRGSFRWEDYNHDGVRDPEEFIPDEHGSYFLFEERLDDYRPVNEVRARTKLDMEFSPRLTAYLISARQPIQTETTFEVNEKSTERASDLFLLNLSTFRKRGKTSAGDARLQEDVTLPLRNGGSVRLRYFRLDMYNAEFISGAERKKEEEHSLRLRLPVTEESDAEFTAAHSQFNRFMELRPSGDYKVTSLTGNSEFSYYPTPPVKLSLAFGGGYDRDIISTLKAHYYTINNSLTYHFSGRGRIEASYALTTVNVKNNPAEERLPYTMAGGKKEGDNHDVSVIADYRLSQRMNLVVTYTGRQFANQKFEHFAQAQMRALF